MENNKYWYECDECSHEKLIGDDDSEECPKCGHKMEPKAF